MNQVWQGEYLNVPQSSLHNHNTLPITIAMFLLGWTLIVNLVTIGVFVLWYIKRKQSYWSSKNVPGPEPRFLVGNVMQRFTQPPDEMELNWMIRYGKVYGIYYGLRPVLTVIDHQLIKQILVKDFSLFANRREVSTYHEVWSENLFLLETERWKMVRALVTPTFTTGKLKGMNSVMTSCVKRLDDYFETIIAANNNSSTSFPVKEVFTGLTLDVIARTIFASEIDSNNITDRNNVFVQHALSFFSFPKLKVIAFLAFPRALNNLLGVRHTFLDKDFDFFMNLSRSVMQSRMASSDSGNKTDFMQMLLDASINEKDLESINYDKLTATGDEKEQTESTTTDTNNNNMSAVDKRKLTANEIIATSILLFVAGFETTATTLNYALWEIAHNQQIQERLYRQLSEGLDGKDSDEYFKVINTEIPYLEAIIKETLRKYPPVVRLERRLTADHYKLNGIELCRDQLIEIPTYAVHHCPEYYPEPQKYRPERFMPENKHLLVPYTYLPFGAGPRNCVGMRFAYQELKLVLAQLVTKYRFEPTRETPSKFSFRLGSPMLATDSFALNVSKR